MLWISEFWWISFRKNDSKLYLVSNKSAIIEMRVKLDWHDKATLLADCNWFRFRFSRSSLHLKMELTGLKFLLPTQYFTTSNGYRQHLGRAFLLRTASWCHLSLQSLLVEWSVASTKIIEMTCNYYRASSYSHLFTYRSHLVWGRAR